MESLQDGRVVSWIADNGDQTCRLDYPLSSDSVVFDLGGYKGEWAQQVFDRYGAQVFIFEPVSRFFNDIVSRFKDNLKIHPYMFGLGKGVSKVRISLGEDASRVGSGTGPEEEIEIRDFKIFLNENAIKKIDLIKINIEGSEYDLLDYIIEEGLHFNIVNFQIQFHDFESDSKTRMEKIQKELEKTHFRTYEYPFVWENWKRLEDVTDEDRRRAQEFYRRRFLDLDQRFTKAFVELNATKELYYKAEDQRSRLINSIEFKVGLAICKFLDIFKIVKFGRYVKRKLRSS